MYAFLPFLALLSLYVSTSLLKNPTPRQWVYWVLTNALGVYVYYYLGLLSLSEATVLLIIALQRQRRRAWLLAQLGLVATYLPWLAIMHNRLDQSLLSLPISTTVHLTPSEYAFENLQSFTVGFSLPPDGQYLMILFLALSLFGTVCLGRRQPLLLVLLILSALIPFVAAGLFLLFRPFFFPRFILFVVVPIWSLVAIGLTAERRAWPLALVLLGLILAGNGWTWYHERTSPRPGETLDDYRTVFASLAAVAQPGDLVICGYPWQVGYVEAYLVSKNLRPVFMPGRIQLSQITSLLSQEHRVWVYAYSPDYHFDGDWPELDLQSIFVTRFIDQFGDSRIRLFTPATTATPSVRSVVATLGNTIALQSADIQSTRLKPGNQVQIILHWRALARPDADYTVFVHVARPDQRIQAQVDAPPIQGEFPTKQWSTGEEIVDRYSVTLPADTPPGSYLIEVGMYLPSTGQRLKVGPAPRPNDEIPIGVITVEPSESSRRLPDSSP